MYTTHTNNSRTSRSSGVVDRCQLRVIGLNLLGDLPVSIEEPTSVVRKNSGGVVAASQKAYSVDTVYY